MGKPATITFFATHNFNPISNLLKLCGSCSGVVQCMAEKRAVITLQTRTLSVAVNLAYLESPGGGGATLGILW